MSTVRRRLYSGTVNLVHTENGTPQRHTKTTRVSATMQVPPKCKNWHNARIGTYNRWSFQLARALPHSSCHISKSPALVVTSR